MRFGKAFTDMLEKSFFGTVDKRGAAATAFFDSYEGIKAGTNETFRELIMYMGAQRFRTPRGLEWITRQMGAKNQTQALIFMRNLFGLYGTMWMEGVWEFAKAKKSPTKFIISDEPITFFNRKIYPAEEAYPGREDLSKVGTRTLFPLGPETCVIVTHVQLTRNPHVDSLQVRINARAFQQTLAKLTDLQFGRELEEQEVLRINYMLKRRATRYIASSNREWLYPERRMGIVSWEKLDEDWFLFPHLWKIPFTSEIVMGFNDGTAWGVDEYGRMPGNPKFRDQEQHERDWITCQNAKHEWAKKRAGKAVARVDNSMREDEVGDGLMSKYLEG